MDCKYIKADTVLPYSSALLPPDPMFMFIKRWSLVELFTIFENHVYSHYINLMFTGFFVALKLIATCNSYWVNYKS